MGDSEQGRRETTPVVQTGHPHFPAEIAHAHGLPTDRLAVLEAPGATPSQNNLYKALLLFFAHHAVDLSEDDVPLVRPSVFEPCDDDQEDQGERDGDKDKDKDGDGDASTSAADNNSVNSVNNVNNKAKASPANAALLARLPPRARSILSPAPNDTLITVRHSAGRLSSLWTCPRDDREAIDPASDSDDDDDVASLVADIQQQHQLAQPLSSTNPNHLFATFAHPVHNLRAPHPPLIHRLQFGLGFAKLRFFHDHAEHLLLLRHFAILPPITLFNQPPSICRSALLAAGSAHVLRVFATLVLKWHEHRNAIAATPRPGMFVLYRYRINRLGGHWHRQSSKRARPQHSVILDRNMRSRIIHDIKQFVSKETKLWYYSHGIPHRRSLLFYGPPGTGKTSTIKMLAGLFRLNACFLSFTSGNFSNQSLHDALARLPSRPLLVLEDVDALFNEMRKTQSDHGLTFSGLLNALDGIVSVDGVVSIFTTNHIERLDSALLRAGRIDRRFEFLHPNAGHVAAVFRSFYPEAEKGLGKEFAEKIMRRKEADARSIATMQQHFIYARKMSAEACVEAVDEFFDDYFSDRDRERSSIYM